MKLYTVNPELVIDFEQLSSQKLLLLEIIGEGHELDELQGIINLIDEVQDQSSKQLGDCIVFEDTPRSTSTNDTLTVSSGPLQLTGNIDQLKEISHELETMSETAGCDLSKHLGDIMYMVDVNYQRFYHLNEDNYSIVH